MSFKHSNVFREPEIAICLACICAIFRNHISKSVVNLGNWLAANRSPVKILTFYNMLFAFCFFNVIVYLSSMFPLVFKESTILQFLHFCFSTAWGTMDCVEKVEGDLGNPVSSFALLELKLENIDGHGAIK